VAPRPLGSMPQPEPARIVVVAFIGLSLVMCRGWMRALPPA
jgi:hypothetical protein